MKLPTVKRLVIEEIDTKVPWLGKLIAPLNSFLDSTFSALNKGINITDNMDGEIREVVLDGTYPYKLSWTRKLPPKVAWVAYCREQTGNHTTITTAVFLDWEYNSSGQFQINNVTGISPSGDAKYILRIIILCG